MPARMGITLYGTLAQRIKKYTSQKEKRGRLMLGSHRRTVAVRTLIVRQRYGYG